MIISTLINILIFFESFVYPIYRSLRIYRKKEEVINRTRILKYWVIYCLLYLLQYYADYLLKMLDVIDPVLFVIYLFLVIKDFEYSEVVYDFCIDDVIKT
mmetsp:Transcript_19302/g.18450  ORF Transcript_19302/g.18450 Transcript_19302/m.18450 type:complete len:100 (-) Transcript_19302:171-470(-)